MLYIGCASASPWGIQEGILEGIQEGSKIKRRSSGGSRRESSKGPKIQKGLRGHLGSLRRVRGEFVESPRRVRGESAGSLPGESEGSPRKSAEVRGKSAGSPREVRGKSAEVRGKSAGSPREVSEKSAESPRTPPYKLVTLRRGDLKGDLGGSGGGSEEGIQWRFPPGKKKSPHSSDIL